MYVNKCTKCGAEFETKNPKRVICPNCLYSDKKSESGESEQQEKPASYSSGGYSTESFQGRDERPRYNQDRPRYDGQRNYNQQRPYNSQRPYQNQRYDNRGGYDRPARSYDGNNEGGYQRPQSNYRSDGGYNRPQGGYNRPQSGGYRNDGGYNRPQGGYNRPQGNYNRPQGGYNRPQGGYNRPQGGFRPQGRPQQRPAKQLLVNREQLAQIEELYKKMLPLPNPDAHEVIGEQIGLEARKVFFGINLIRQKMMLPKLPFPKRKLAVSPDQLIAIKALYEPLLPLPPIGCHKIISAQLKIDEWRVHVGIGLVRKQMGLERWNPEREDAPEEFKKPVQDVEKEEAPKEKEVKKTRTSRAKKAETEEPSENL